MSEFGYKQTFRPCLGHVRFTLSFRHSSAEVRFRPDFFGFTPGNRPSWWCRRRAEPDPKRPFVKPEAC